MSYQNIHLDLNIEAKDLKQNLSLTPIVDKINAIGDDAPYGTKILGKELLNLIEDNTQHNKNLADNLLDWKPIFEILGNLSGDFNLNKDEYIAFANPIPDEILYSTNALAELALCGLKLYVNKTNSIADHTFTNKIIYYLILERFYGINALETELIFESSCEGFTKYFELKIDFSFVDIQYDGEIPRINLAALRKNKYDSYDLLHNALSTIDLNKFTFQGVSILRFTNKDKEFTTKRLQEIIKNIFIKDKQFLTDEINSIFRSIVRKNNIQYFFLPIFELSGFPISENEYAKKSILLGHYLNASKQSNSCAIYSYMSEPCIWSYGIEKDLNIEDSVFVDILKSKDIQTYLGVPLFHGERFVGFLEIYSYEMNFDSNDALKLKPYLPHFAQLANDLVTYLKNQLNKIILENYTSIQPTLQWRFNEVAVSYLSKLSNKEENSALEKIVFKDVYPMYGAIDVKDSTRLRNSSQKQSILQHLNSLQNLIAKFEQSPEFDQFEWYKENINTTYECIKEKGVEKNILNIRDFLEKKVSICLEELKGQISSNAELMTLINDVQQQNKQILEIGNDPFERSLAAITKMIRVELDDLNDQLQTIFPCYFETFRTDGIEYDAYIGQSITPTAVFDEEILDEMRKLQILSMVQIINLHLEIGIVTKTIGDGHL